MIALTDNTRGALLMMASMAAFTLNDALMKTLSGEMSLYQAVFLRGTMTSAVLAVWAFWTGALWPRGLAGADLGRAVLRMLFDVGATWFFLTALFHMPIANVTAILQVLPLTVTLAAALFLGEPVGWRRLAAIAVGFLGVLLIVRPGLAGFNVHSVFALVAVLFVTARDIVTRRLSRGVPSLFVALIGAVGVTAFGALGLLGASWASVTVSAAARLMGASTLMLGAYIFAIAAMRVGEVAVVTPFRYTGLLWALALGLALFGEWPEPLTLIGAAVVVATGIYTFHRERALAQATRPAVD